ncbi:hypothetical protein J6590_046008 [Homalodisca vitripennis]|nr:hypothetical protein J6590_046008 [Homalodisca vitripennis]
MRHDRIRPVRSSVPVHRTRGGQLFREMMRRSLTDADTCVVCQYTAPEVVSCSGR